MDLSHNSFGASGIVEISHALTSNAKLLKLDIGFNRIGPSGAQVRPRPLAHRQQSPHAPPARAAPLRRACRRVPCRFGWAAVCACVSAQQRGFVFGGGEAPQPVSFSGRSRAAQRLGAAVLCCAALRMGCAELDGSGGDAKARRAGLRRE